MSELAGQEPAGQEGQEDDRLKAWVRDGNLVEWGSEMTPAYRKVLTETMMIAADLELSVLPWTYDLFDRCPSVAAKISLVSAMRDELGHAHVMYSMLEDFGFDTQELIFQRPPDQFHSFYMLDFKLEDFIMFVVAQALLDRSGRTTTVDLEDHCSYAPYRRALRKINYEEKFHVAHGEQWVRYYWNLNEKTRARVQACVDLLFPHGVMWFGVTDELKKRKGQLDFHIRGESNDQMRQQWLAQTVRFAESVGFKLPAHYDEERGEYVLEYELPIVFDEAAGRWDFRKATWAEVFAQWKKGGPNKKTGFARIQREEWGALLWE